MNHARFLKVIVLILFGFATLIRPNVARTYQATDRVIYDDALATGWDNWSWDSTIDFAATDATHSGSAALAITINAAWAGLYLHSQTGLQYQTLRFWIRGNGQTLVVFLANQSGAFVEGARITPPLNTWTQVDVPLTALNGAALWGFSLADGTGNPQPRFLVDDIQLMGGQAPVALALTINANANQHPISPYIYGLNFADPILAADIRLPVNRWGGNATTRYNWQNDTSNRGSDWYFENIPEENANPAALPNGSSADRFIARNVALGTDTLLTIPMIGWTPNSRAGITCGFSVSEYGPQQSTDPYRPDCGNGVHPNGTLMTGNDPTDTSTAIGPTFVQAWMQHLMGQFGTAARDGVRFYNLDNEPALWNSTHRDVHPQPLSYDQLRDLTYQYAAAIKATDPNALTVGPAEWGWSGYFYSALDMASGPQWWLNPPDRNAHGGLPISAWYLQQMQLYEQQHGIRILDYFDLHYYPQSNGVALSPAGDANTQALRLRSTRSLWDPTYVDESWINEPVMLIPRMQAWIDQYYPGTQIAISEYNFGGLESINGALTQADVLGIFGREGVDLATMWDPPTADQPAAYAFRIYCNYDGSGNVFGDTSVQATSTDQERLSIYAALRSDGVLTVVIINKTNGALSSPLTINGFAGTTAEVYRYSAANLGQIVRENNMVLSNAAIEFPASSITLLVIR